MSFCGGDGWDSTHCYGLGGVRHDAHHDVLNNAHRADWDNTRHGGLNKTLNAFPNLSEHR